MYTGPGLDLLCQVHDRTALLISIGFLHTALHAREERIARRSLEGSVPKSLAGLPNL